MTLARNGGCTRARWPRRAVVAVAMFGLATFTALPAIAAGALVSRTVTVDDLRVHYLEAGAGEPVLLLHGLVASADMWRDMATILARHYRVIAPDARGRGDTREGRGSLSDGRFARDVIGLMDRLGIARAHVVGHSQGSITAIHLMVDYPERVATAVLIGSPMMSRQPPTPAIQGMLLEIGAIGHAPATADPVLLDFAANYRRAAINPGGLDAFVTRLVAERAAAYDPGVLPLIRTPVLVFVAGRDELIPEAHFRALAAAIGGAETVEFPDGTHILPIEAPAACAAAIEAFLAAHPLTPFAPRARPR